MAAASGTSRPGGISPIMIGAGVGVVAIVVAIILIITLSGGPKDETLADVSPTTAETEEVVAPEETTQVPEETPETPETPEAEPTEEVVVEPSPTIDVTIPRGRAEFSDTAVFLLMEAVESLESGFTYEGWLIPEEGDPVSIGLLNGNEIAFEAEGDPLLLAYKGVGLSLEPENDTDPAVNGAFMYTAMVDEALLNHARALYKHTFNRGASFQDALLQGIVSQARQYDSHLGFSVDSINNSNLPGAKSHGEHMINIASGIEDTANYGDWNGDGRVENPGDNVGLETYLHLLGESIRSLPDAEDHQDLLDSIDQYILTVQDARRLGQRITAADTVGEVSTFPTDLSNLKLSSAISQLVNAVSELDLKIAAEVFREAP